MSRFRHKPGAGTLGKRFHHAGHNKWPDRYHPSFLTASTCHPVPARNLASSACSAKEHHTVPDTYHCPSNPWWPLQPENRRHPVIEAQRGRGAGRHRHLGAGSGRRIQRGRVTRYAHNMEKALRLPSPGRRLAHRADAARPQTAGELDNCDACPFRRHLGGAAFLQELAERPDGAMVPSCRAARLARECWAHCSRRAASNRCSGPGSRPSADPGVGEIAALKTQVARLEVEVDRLKSLVDTLCAERGMPG